MRPLAGLNNDLQEAAASAERLEEVLALPVEDNTREHRTIPEPRPRRGDAAPAHPVPIRFDAVAYRYPDADTDAVRGVTLRRGALGRRWPSSGPMARARRRCSSLLPRLINPTRGRLLVDGTDIAEGLAAEPAAADRGGDRKASVLFQGTLADNIAYGRRHVAREQIEAAARAAHADEFIRHLPLGLDTVLAEGGAGLSGGQQQRLCIARAVLRDPAILILDEATSQIDANSEGRITAALAEFQRGRTTFVIAHRLSTVVGRGRDRGHGRGTDRRRGTARRAACSGCELYAMLTRTQLSDHRGDR